MRLRVLIVDDALLYRHVIGRILRDFPWVEVVGTAATGRQALSMIESLRPDVVTLDIEMPVMDGLEVLREMKGRGLRAGVVLLSARTPQGGMKTMRALELGAFDFVAKPTGPSQIENTADLRDRLEPVLRAYAGRRASGRGAPVHAPAPAKAPDPGTRSSGRSAGIRHADMILIGVSTGGPSALTEVLPHLPASLDVPVLVVQHMPPVFTRSLADSLRPRCAMEIKEAEPNEPARPNCVYIAPGGRHMRIVSRACVPVIEIDDDPPENNCRPSVDHLFRSVSETFGRRVVAVILTGMGNDGTAGMKLLKAKGATTIAQDEATSVVFGMPREAIQAGVVDHVLPLAEIADRITGIVQGKAA